MAERTGIEWTDHTWNPVIGCTAVSSACDGCYAKAHVERFGGDFAIRRRTSVANWKLPLVWNRAAERHGVRSRVFCASLADVFDNQWPDGARADMWDVIRAMPALDWQLLTKRPQNIARMLPDDWGAGWPNVWLGATVENQTEADRRIPHLLAIPARVRFLSCEPLLSHVSLDEALSDEGGRGMHYRRHGTPRINWVIVGGESGPRARPMHLDWARALRDQCAAAAVPFFFKQWGEWASLPCSALTLSEHVVYARADGTIRQPGNGIWQSDQVMQRVGKKRAGAMLDGREHREFPT